MFPLTKPLEQDGEPGWGLVTLLHPAGLVRPISLPQTGQRKISLGATWTYFWVQVVWWAKWWPPERQVRVIPLDL